MMKTSSIERGLLEVFEDIEIIDAHEHLRPEKMRVKWPVDVFTLFSHYTRFDLIAAGMSPEVYWNKIQNPNCSLEERWRIFAPYLKYIRHGSFARPAFIAAKEIYGFDDINRYTYKALSDRIVSENKPGIYHRILSEKCNIRLVLTQAKRTDFDVDFLIPLMPIDDLAHLQSRREVEQRAEKIGVRVKTLREYLDLVKERLEVWISEGVVGIKMISLPYEMPSQEKAIKLFSAIMQSKNEKNVNAYISKERNPLYVYLIDEILKMAAELRLVVAVHSGGIHGDFRRLDPKNMIPIFMRHPNTMFDLYHMGMPWVRDTAIIGKNFPNVWLNLCWSHIISPKMTCSALDEWLDIVPINKIIAFGGDYGLPVEKVYGHLVMAKENIAKVLGHRIKEGLMSEEEAISIAKRWFYQNARDLYNLKV